ncbi:hypothetical protein BGZ81_007739 [Podila clonocystis]|nr:hypothetical protein BGZ81_007739 [Podila clonocystis]
MTTQQKTLSTLSSSSSSSDSSSSELSDQVLRPPVTLGRSVSGSNRQSVFLEHGEESKSSSQGPNLSDDQEDMKEVEIETEDPSHLFWVPFHLHPEIAPNEYNKWLSKHGVDSNEATGLPSSRSPSVTRRKSVLSALYNPDDDTEDRPSKPAKIEEKSEESEHDFLSGVFSMPLEQMGEPPLKTKTSLRRSVSLSVQSPTREHFSTDLVSEDLMNAKRPSGLERGGLSLLRRSARTKIRRNSTASNDTRNDVSRLRQTIDINGEYPAVSLVDPGPLPLPSSTPTPPSSVTSPTSPTSPTENKAVKKEGETQPLRRFVSTLRDSSKPTITTYVEPHLLEQQRREIEEEEASNMEKDESSETPSFRISAPGKLENSISRPSQDSSGDRKDKVEQPDNFTISYPIPPPVKLSQNLLQQPTQPSSHPLPPSLQGPKKQTHPPTAPNHSKKPSTWSWLWGKEKGAEKSIEPQSGTLGSSKSAAPTHPSHTDVNTQGATSIEAATKKQSTLSMLFSRNGKASKAQATTADSHATTYGYSGQSSSSSSSSSDKPKYSNYNRLPIHIERAIYRLSHVKLANPRRPLHEQVLISNMMFWYLGVIQQQQVLQQQADLQQQQQLEQQQQQMQQKRGDTGKSAEGKEAKSKTKPKKKKSQKKKNGSRGSSKGERVVNGPEFEHQHQQQQQQQQQQRVQRPRQAGASIPVPSSADSDYDEESMLGGTADYSDSYEDSDGDECSAQQRVGSRSDTLSTLSIKSAEEEDDVPLAHYQNIRQTVPV